MPELACEPALVASFAFGEIPIIFESTDRHWLSLLDRRYGPFRVSPGAGGFRVRFEPRATPVPPEVETPLAIHLEAIHCERTRSGFRVETETTSCTIDLPSRQAVLHGPSAMYPLDNLLRHLLPLLWEEGVLLHAAAIEYVPERGVLACGPSGAGKSTLAHLAGTRALCDELTAVRCSGSSREIVSLPFWVSRPGRAELRAILLLAHGTSHRLVPLRPEAAWKRLVTQVSWPVWDESATGRCFESLVHLVQETPVFELSFTPADDVWPFLEKEVP